MTMDIFAAITLGVACLLGIALTILGLPGIWMMILAALGIEVWRPDLLSTEALIISSAVALLAEVAEFLAGAAGAKKAGGSRRAAGGAIVGGIVGGLIGTVAIPIPIIGTILGASLGAGILAAALELTHEGRTLDSARRVGTGAFVGRFLATVVKSGFAVVAALVLIVAACVAGW